MAVNGVVFCFYNVHRFTWSSTDFELSTNGLPMFTWKIAVKIEVEIRNVLEYTLMPYGIPQCYLPPGRSDIPAFTPAEAGTLFSDPGGMQG